MSKEVRVIGNLNADLVLYPLSDFPTWGSEVMVSHMGWRPGGVGNVLLCLARLGVGVSAIANVGDDTIGQELLSILEEARIDLSHTSLNEGQALTGETSPQGCLEALFARCPWIPLVPGIALTRV